MQQFLYQKNFQKLKAHKNRTIPYAEGRTIKPRKLPQPRQLKEGRRKDICANTTTTKLVDFEASINRTTQIMKLEPKKLGLTCCGSNPRYQLAIWERWCRRLVWELVDAGVRTARRRCETQSRVRKLDEGFEEEANAAYFVSIRQATQESKGKYWLQTNNLFSFPPILFRFDKWLVLY